MASDGKTPGNGSSALNGPTGGSRARPFVQQQNPQGPVRDVELDQSSVPAGGKVLLADVSPQRASQVGTTAGANRKPFALKG